MRMSIWQQFASNHSSSFTVIGQFASEVDAEKAAHEVRRIVKAIADYYAEHPDAQQDWLHGGIAPPTPPEKEMAARYELEIAEDRGLDWIKWYTPVEKAVAYFEHIVFVTNTGITWDGAYPFNVILEKLGGSVLVHGNKHHAGEVREKGFNLVRIKTLTCVAPDETIADSIATQMNRLLQEHMIAPSKPLKSPWQSPEVKWHGADSGYCERIEQQGRKLIFEDFYFANLAYGLPAFITYLERNGCMEIQYEFVWSVRENR
jgi:hypothetical protein